MKTCIYKLMRHCTHRLLWQHNLGGGTSNKHDALLSNQCQHSASELTSIHLSIIYTQTQQL